MTPNPYPLAASLARPVARGQLTLTEAHATLLATALRDARRGSPYDPFDVYRGLRHILRLRLEAEEQRRAMVAFRIRRRLKPLIALRKPPNVLLAEAHGVNGEGGFPFEEPDVNDIATLEMYWSMPRRPNHVR